MLKRVETVSTPITPGRDARVLLWGREEPVVNPTDLKSTLANGQGALGVGIGPGVGVGTATVQAMRTASAASARDASQRVVLIERRVCPD